MTFLHGYLLGGLLLVSVPFLVHLIMREKPRHLRFPAFRFLRQRFDVTQNRLRVQHWLLMLLRMLVVALICLALTRPRLFTEGVALLGDQPVAVVLVFDTSPSMEYQQGGESRLDHARRKAMEMLDELPAGSRVAVLDSSETGGEFLLNLGMARERVQGLQIKPVGVPVTRQLGTAVTLLSRLEDEIEPGAELPPRFLYVFSDRTLGSWDTGEGRSLKNRWPEEIQTVYVDVGVEQVADLSIDRVEIEPAHVPPGGTVNVRVTVRATGSKSEAELVCQFDNEPAVERQLVRLAGGDSQILTFERKAAREGATGLREGFHQVTVRLKPDDALPFNNQRQATFVIRPGRTILTVVDRADSGVEDLWRVALEVRGFRCDVRTLKEFNDLGPDDLKKYDVIALFQLVDPPGELWNRLFSYVQEGGGLAVVPGGADMNRGAYTGENARKLMPGAWQGVVTAPKDPGVMWAWGGGGAKNAFVAPFDRWRRTSDVEFQRPEGEPTANRYWQVTPTPEVAEVLLSYADLDRNPVLLERRVGRGKVLQFTTPLDSREEVLRTGEPRRRWHNYWETSFGLVLADRACRHLAGESEADQLNLVCGQLVVIPLSAQAAGPFKLNGPQLRNVLLAEPARDEGASRPRDLPIARAVAAGNYTVLDAKDAPLAAFSLNVRREEAILDRLPAADVEEVLGEKTVLGGDQPMGLRKVLDSRSQPVELLPLLMILLLLGLAGESLLGNLNRAFQKQADPRAAPPFGDGLGLRSLLTLAVWGGGGALAGALLGWAQVLGYSEAWLGALVTGLLGLVHGVLMVARLPLRASMVLGGILGAMVGVMYGGALVLRQPEWEGPPVMVLASLVGGVVMAADGWLVARLARPLRRAEGS